MVSQLCHRFNKTLANDFQRLAMHDTETWTDPEVFRPERFMDSANDTSPDPALYVFGFGKRYVTAAPASIPLLIGSLRLCPGKHLAERILHLVIVQTLALFTIEPAPGMDRQSTVEFSTGFLRLVVAQFLRRMAKAY